MSVTHPRGRILCGLLVALVALGGLLASASSAQARLVFKRPNGSVIRFNGTPRVWCGPWEGMVARPALHIELNNGKPLGARWELRAVQSDIEIGRRIKFPNSFVFDRPEDAFLFVGALSRRGASRLIEASTSEEESSGSMVFRQASCELGSTVELEIHAVLGSELFEGTRVRVNGTFSGQVGEVPAEWISADSAK